MGAETGEPTYMKSGYPLFPHQQRALDALPKQFVGRHVDKVEATITPEELYEKYMIRIPPNFIFGQLEDIQGIRCLSPPPKKKHFCRASPHPICIRSSRQQAVSATVC